MDQSRVEICIPTFNEAESIDAVLEALCGQTHANFSVRVFDNASTDSTTAICETFRDRLDIEVVAKTRNVGQTININRSYLNAKADYVAIISGNDIVSENYIETLLGAVAGADNVAAAYAHATLVDENRVPQPVQPNWRFYSITEDDPVERCCRAMMEYNQGTQFCALYRRGVLDRMRPKPWVFGGDHIFAAEAALYGKVIYCEEADVLRSRPPGAEDPRKRLKHLTTLFSLDAQRGVAPQSKLSRLEQITPTIDMIHGFIDMARLSDLPAPERSRLISQGVAGLLQLHQRSIHAEMTGLLGIAAQVLPHVAEPGNFVNRIMVLSVLRKIDQCRLLMNSSDLERVQGQFTALLNSGAPLSVQPSHGADMGGR
jgi:hypothetical protein